MLLIIVLNAILSAFVVLATAGLHLSAIRRSHLEQGGRDLLRFPTGFATRTSRARKALRYGPATPMVRPETASPRAFIE